MIFYQVIENIAFKLNRFFEIALINVCFKRIILNKSVGSVHIRRKIIPITVIKFPAQSYVCVQSTSEIDEEIVITDIQNCRYFVSTCKIYNAAGGGFGKYMNVQHSPGG
ncbi:hypothetical protein D5R81_20250 [Parashewanella spongiae]|uniref:Uncharacterized protein n=1 Tax=Parashewanella spongiae TaxID=342950 RepID=A0A3A6SN44_9GAMM|nr:hypothetical protein D5R81_20250 [Parashewanella spongiae]